MIAVCKMVNLVRLEETLTCDRRADKKVDGNYEIITHYCGSGTKRPRRKKDRATLRSDTAIWLIGQTREQLNGTDLPTKREAMQLFYHLVREQQQSVRQSAKLTALEIRRKWVDASCPPRKLDRIIEKVEKIYLSYRQVQKSKARMATSTTERLKVERFDQELDGMLDIRHGNIMKMFVSDNDKEYFEAQLAGRKMCFGSVDAKLAITQKKVQQGKDAEEQRKAKEADRVQQLNASRSVCIENNPIHEEDDSESSPEKRLPQKVMKLDRRRKQYGVDRQLALTLDRTGTSSRTAEVILKAAANSWNLGSESVACDNSTIIRTRNRFRKESANNRQTEFRMKTPGVVHFDSKLLPSIDNKGAGGNVDRLPVVVPGQDVEELLGVPKFDQSSGLKIAESVVECVKEWHLEDNIVAMCFDTTSVNTGPVRGACQYILQFLEKDLLYFPCQHHIDEIVLKDVFGVLFGPSSGPEYPLFRRFQAKWHSIDGKPIRTGPTDDRVRQATADISEDTISFCMSLLRSGQPRDDYRECLELTVIFLGGELDHPFKIRSPGALHRARWMAPAIYSLKIWLHQDNFPDLRKKETEALTDICLFIVLVYVRVWFEAPIAARAPALALRFLNSLKMFATINEKVSECGLKKLSKHLWYLNGENVALSLFDSSVSVEDKKKIVEAMLREDPDEDYVPHRRAIIDLQTETKQLCDFASPSTRRFFTITGISTVFLHRPCEDWETDDEYIAAKQTVDAFRIVNDSAERAVKLVTDFNNKVTKKEDQKQYLLQVVAQHRKKHSWPS